ncbi:hypothetical protein [Rhizobium sp. SG2393]|uniref:hypothetical protein n=1 Tax=Rhizobium sp. SG2393 TaxID=3276279 RepID=UPI003670F8F6
MRDEQGRDGGRQERRENPNREAHLALKALQSVGGLNWKTICWFVGLVVIVNLISTMIEPLILPILDGLWTLASSLARSLGLWAVESYPGAGAISASPAAPVADPAVDSPFGLLVLRFGLLLFVFLAIVWKLRRLAARDLSEMRPVVHFGPPNNARVVTMFLSVPGHMQTAEQAQAGMDAYKDEVMAMARHVRLLTDADSSRRIVQQRSALAGENVPPPDRDTVRKAAYAVTGLDNDAGRRDAISARFSARNFNWRMNIEALRPHILGNSRLRRIIVIPSLPVGAASIGSIDVMPVFRDFLGEFLKHHDMGDVRVMTPDELEIPGYRTGMRLPQAVQYESMPDLVEILYRVNTHFLTVHGYRDEDILVDITSGKALCSAAGMAFATLVDRRHVQYVDTNTFAVRSYDVTHDVDRA